MCIFYWLPLYKAVQPYLDREDYVTWPATYPENGDIKESRQKEQDKPLYSKTWYVNSYISKRSPTRLACHNDMTSSSISPAWESAKNLHIYSETGDKKKSPWQNVEMWKPRQRVQTFLAMWQCTILMTVPEAIKPTGRHNRFPFCIKQWIENVLDQRERNPPWSTLQVQN